MINAALNKTQGLAIKNVEHFLLFIFKLTARLFIVYNVQANKVMHMEAMAYNLKKLLKFISKSTQVKKRALLFVLIQIFNAILAKISFSKPLNFSQNLYKKYAQKNQMP